VARIAQDYLEDTSPQTLQQTLRILRHSSFQSYVYLEDKYPFVECATFADDIKNDGFSDQSLWHYVNTPLLTDVSYTVPPSVPVNITWAIDEMIKSLKQVTSKYSSPPHVDPSLAQSFNLRLLIHYVGDIHQPLHAVTRFATVTP
jgi:hypothetical protein